MLSKRFMHVCLGLLALVAAFELGSGVAHGQSGAFRVVGTGMVVVGDAVYWLDVNGASAGWKLLPNGSFTLPPVPASSLIQYESGSWAITDSGEGWGLVFGSWTDLGPVPGTPTVRTTWGQVKAKYRP